MRVSTRVLAFAAGLLVTSLTRAQDPSTFDQKVDTASSPVLGPCVQGATALCIPLDATFQVVNFDGVGGNGPANPGDVCQRNDDDVTLVRNLQFTFNLYGQSFNQVFINNNGNVSFGSSFSTFTSTGFPVNGFPMVAPFWGDVDTRDLASGVVYFKSELHRFTVIWDHVGYYNIHSNLKNTFELILSDGLDPIVGVGNNVCFCYDDMQWTTGDASGGAGGFGGTPATVGVNAGDGINFFQIGRFDHAGADYDGPGGAADGVSYLDNKHFCFAAGALGNQPPIYLNPPMGCLMTSVGVPLNFSIQAIGPELNQTVTMTVNDGGLPNFSCIVIPGNPATANCTFNPGPMQTGTFNITYTACDNFNPQACTTLTVCIAVAECHLVLGSGFGPHSYIIFGHLYDTEIAALQGTWPVTMQEMPSFPAPSRHGDSQQFRWLPGQRYGRPIFAQVVMYNPEAFPGNPSQWSQTLRVVFKGSEIELQRMGTSNGISISATTFVDTDGSIRLRFPFTINGM